jgi:hypothetical protein
VCCENFSPSAAPDSQVPEQFGRLRDTLKLTQKCDYKTGMLMHAQQQLHAAEQ